MIHQLITLLNIWLLLRLLLKRSKKKTHKNKTPKKCSCGTHTYTGSENTPYGLGKCSKCLPKRVVMKGRDKKLYENTENGWRNLT